MDQYTKIALTVIAAGIVIANIQLFGDELVRDAHAHSDDHYHYAYQIYDLAGSHDHHYDYASRSHSHY
jgi:hypothetical protein